MRPIFRIVGIPVTFTMVCVSIFLNWYSIAALFALQNDAPILLAALNLLVFTITLLCTFAFAHVFVMLVLNRRI